jgi:DNA-binding NarL/FixJ family response regulator
VLLEVVGYFGLAGKPVRSRQAHGASTGQIGRELYLSAVTVRNHISHILGQLGVHSRPTAVANARRLGPVED